MQPDTFNNAILLRQMEQGCRQSFNALYNSHWEAAFSSAYKRLKDYNQAKDIVQEIFTHIWLNRETLHIENPGSLFKCSRTQQFIYNTGLETPGRYCIL